MSEYRIGNPQGYNSDQLFKGEQVIAQMSGLPLNTHVDELKDGRLATHPAFREGIARAKETVQILNAHADLLDDLRAALDWIEQRATTEKDGLLVERLQKTIDNGAKEGA